MTDGEGPEDGCYMSILITIATWHHVQRTSFIFAGVKNIPTDSDLRSYRANKLFKNVSQFRYLGTTVTNHNLNQGVVRKSMNSGNACYHSVQNVVFLSAVEKRKH
jgi:hypothetical protein